MITYVTAKGKDNKSGDEGTIIQVGITYKLLNEPESLIWHQLLWSIMEYNELQILFDQIFTRVYEFKSTIDQLMNQNLLAFGSGATKQDALFSLFEDVKMASIGAINTKQRMAALRTLLKRGDITPLQAVKVMVMERLTYDERYILSLLKDTPCTFNELVNRLPPIKCKNGIQPPSCASNEEIWALATVLRAYQNRRIIFE